MSGIFGQYPSVSASGGSGGLSSISFSIGILDAGTPNQNGASVSSNSIFLQSATTVFPGLVNSASQTFSGIKTFNQPLGLAANGSASLSAGQMIFDNVSQCITFQNIVSSISLQIGQENWVQVFNNSGATVGNGQAVYSASSVLNGDMPIIALAQANTSSTSALLGVATHDIANNSVGYVTQIGKVHGINTAAYSPGQRVWLSTASAGFFQVTDPSPPNFSVFVGYVLNVGSTTGSLLLSGVRTGTITPFLNPLKNSGDLIIGSSTVSGVSGAVSLGLPNQYLGVSSGSLIPVWQVVNIATQTQGSLSLATQTQGSLSLTTQVVGVLPTANGGSTGSNTGDVSVGPIGSSSSASGAVMGTGQVLVLTPTDGTNPGLVTTGTQTIAGAKTFANIFTLPGGLVSAPSLLLGTSETNTGLYKAAANQLAVTVAGTQQGLWTTGGYTTTTTKATSFLFGGGGGNNLTMTVSTVSTYNLVWPGAMVLGSTSILTAGSGSAILSWSAAPGILTSIFSTLGSNSYVTPTNARALKIMVVGGGGGGGGCQSAAASAAAGSGGGGGATLIAWLGGPTGTYSITVGAGGVTGSTGGTGSASQFGGIFLANGGAGGGNGGTNATPVWNAGAGLGAGSGSIGSGIINCFIFINGSDGQPGTILSSTQALGGAGGGTPFSGGVLGRNNTSGAGFAGYLYGGGGSGAASVNNGGAFSGGIGGSGIVIVEAYFS